ncbi:MAG: hypothetical protein JO154_13400 [Chitinophaga sp.]|uniref:hypothetical protein n=1 Tax=Chitinophaga sp. TaxID=1869181 RepID=UPI0025C5F700|nr:hypothetical protein [Chitinophaga sp.]MBV8253597.1 hypothetical protein [Chitinophaga sp.]
MKTPKALVLGSLILMSVLYACKKNDSAPGKTDPKWSGETMKVKLDLTGEIQTGESPLGRQASNARITPDSVIYAVDVRYSGGSPFAQGIYTDPNAIYVTVPKGINYIIRVVAIKRGTGLGLYEYTDSINGGRFLPGNPLNLHIANSMSTDMTGPNKINYTFLDTLGYFNVANYLNGYDTYRNSELECYWGFYQSTMPNTTPTSLAVSLKRMIFGVRFKPQNFYDGNLMIDYDWTTQSKIVPVSDLATTSFTYTTNDFISSDQMRNLPLKLRWSRANGSIINLGSIILRPKRNTMTTVSITAPQSPGIPVGISITENNWQNDTTVVAK